MRQLKYVKVYEAFESSALSGTLNFINKDSRHRFLNSLKTISSKFSFPISKYSDEFFQYLPFKEALELNYTPDSVNICDAKSSEVFKGTKGDYKCEGGIMRRSWGNGTRNVTCPVCNGSGVKSNAKYDIKWVKFWFSKGKEFIGVTITDGSRKDSEVNIRHNLSSFDIVRTITKRELMSSDTGTPVLICFRGYEDYVVGYLYKYRGYYGGESKYIITNNSRYNGSAPSNDGGAYKKYGEYSWDIGEEAFENDIKLLKLKNETKSDDAYMWNYSVDDGLNKPRYELNTEDKLSKAHFAIVLDYMELVNYKGESRSDTIGKRRISKSNALAFRDDDDIKRENINRYIIELQKRVKISNDLKDLNKVMFKFLGHKYCGFYVLKSRNIDIFSTLCDYIYNFITSTNDSDKVENYNRAVSIITHNIESNMEYNNAITSNISYVKRILETNKRDRFLIEIFEKALEINDVVTEKFKSMTFESIEDIEIVVQKMVSIRNITKNSDRFNSTRRIMQIFDNIVSGSSIIYILSYINESETDKILLELETIKRTIIRL